jgi:myo-inositol-hexaphosphate 3-phosphohydrolase
MVAAAAGLLALLVALVIGGSTGLGDARRAAPAASSVTLGAGTHNDTAFAYGGSWKVTTSRAYYRSDDHRTAAAGRTYQFGFDGTQVSLYATKAPGMGIMRVSVDGGAATEVDLYAPTREPQTLVYSTQVLSAGTHHVLVTVTGTKNPAASGRTVNADRVDITAPTVTPGSTPTATEPTVTTEPGATSLPPASALPSGAGFHPFGSVTVASQFNVNGAGKNVDTIAFWEGPTAVESLMFVTSKNVSLVEVWRYPFNAPSTEATALTHSCLQAGADSATNGVVVDQEADLLYVASNFSPNVCVFSLPDLAYRSTITSGVTYGLEPNLTLMELPDGSERLYVSNNRVVFVHDATTGQKLSQCTPTKGLETMWGDNPHQVLYIPDENGRTGIYAYRPDGTAYTRNGTNILGGSTIIDSDAEGILEYTCPASATSDSGEGLIVVSDQIDSTTLGNDYEVFDRRTWAHLGKIKLTVPGGTGFVYNTDGIGTTQQPSAAYPRGLFTAIQDDTSVVGVGWGSIFEAITAQTGTPFGCGD